MAGIKSDYVDSMSDSSHDGTVARSEVRDLLRENQAEALAVAEAERRIEVEEYGGSGLWCTGEEGWIERVTEVGEWFGRHLA